MMESLEDNGKLGEGTNFNSPGNDVKYQGIGGAFREVGDNLASRNPLRAVEPALRRAAQGYNKVIIDWAHVKSFTLFYQRSFFDMANLMSTSMAKAEKLSGETARARAEFLLRDATRIKPTTKAGAILRLESQRNAARVTSTNETALGKYTTDFKNLLNQNFPIVGKTGLGDVLIPIAKIPATLIWNGIENAGPALPEGVWDAYQGFKKIQSNDLATKYEGMTQYAHGVQKLTRFVGTMAIGAYFVSQLSPSDFKTGNYGDSYVKIGGTWINMQYFAYISPMISGLMNAKMNAKPNQPLYAYGEQYAAGVFRPLLGAPGIDEVDTFVNDMADSDYTKGIQRYFSNFFTERGTPAFIPNLLQGKFPNLFFGASGIPSPAELKKLTQKYITIAVK